jgi:hypothetical protein
MLGSFSKFAGLRLIKLKLTMFTSLGLSSIVPDIFKLIMNFFGIIMTGIGNMFSTSFASLGGAVATMFQSFGFSTAQYGVLGPVAFVVGIGLALLIGYLLLVPADAEKQVVEGEDDL